MTNVRCLYNKVAANYEQQLLYFSYLIHSPHSFRIELKKLPIIRQLFSSYKIQFTLHIKSKMHHIAILHYVFFAFHAHFSGFFYCCF